MSTTAPDIGKKFDELLGKMGVLVDQLKAQAEFRTASDNQIADLKRQLAEVEKQIGQIKKGSTVSLPGLEDAREAKAFSFLTVARGLAFPSDKRWENSAEKSILDEARKKALDSTEASGGGYLIPTELVGPIIERYTERTITQRLGAQVISFEGQGTIEMARETEVPEAFWADETGAAQETGSDFAKFNMKPNRLSAYIKLGKRFIYQASGMQAENFVRRRFSEAFARKLDRTSFTGTGSDGQPKGLKVLLGNDQKLELGPDGNTGKEFTLADVAQFEGKLQDANAMVDGGRYAFAAHPRVFRKMKRERIAQFSGDAKGAYVMLPMSDQNLRDAMGYPFEHTTYFPTNLTKGSATGLTEVWFGNFLDVMIGQWMSLVLRASDIAGNGSGSAFLQNQLWIVGDTEVDINVVRTNSICWSGDVIYPSN